MLYSILSVILVLIVLFLIVRRLIKKQKVAVSELTEREKKLDSLTKDPGTAARLVGGVVFHDRDKGRILTRVCLDTKGNYTYRSEGNSYIKSNFIETLKANGTLDNIEGGFTELEWTQFTYIDPSSDSRRDRVW